MDKSIQKIQAGDKSDGLWSSGLWSSQHDEDCGLGKNERRSYLRQYGSEISNDRIPEQWDDFWKEGEKQYRRKQRKG